MRQVEVAETRRDFGTKASCCPCSYQWSFGKLNQPKPSPSLFWRRSECNAACPLCDIAMIAMIAMAVVAAPGHQAHEACSLPLLASSVRGRGTRGRQRRARPAPEPARVTGRRARSEVSCAELCKEAAHVNVALQVVQQCPASMLSLRLQRRPRAEWCRGSASARPHTVECANAVDSVDAIGSERRAAENANQGGGRRREADGKLLQVLRQAATKMFWIRTAFQGLWHGFGCRDLSMCISK